METNPKEIELNFDSSSGQDLEELEKAREALSEEINFNAAPENEVEDFAEEYSDSEDLPVEADPEVEEKAFEPEQSVSNVVNNDTEMLLRSRHPVNRPAGTPPLESNSAEEAVTAMEMVVAGKSYGAALRLLREQHNMSYKELEQVTLIQPHYLEALENEDLRVLPPLVYVIAYIRTLCRFYKVSSDTSQTLVAKLKEQLEYSCNDELMNTLDVDRSGAAANERRLKNIMMVLTGGVLGIIVLVILLVVLFRSGCSDEEIAEKKPAAVSSSAVDSKFNTNKLDRLLPAPDNSVSKLPLDK